MKHVLLALSMTLAAATGWADWESSLYPLCASSFENYAVDEPLTNGTVVAGGYWAIPSDADAFATFSDGRHRLSFSTSETNGIVLNPFSMTVAKNDKAVVSSLKLVGFIELPKVDAEKDRAAIIVYTPESGNATFQGWSADGWQTLIVPSGFVKPVSGDCYDVSIRMRSDPATGRAKVQYRLFNGAEYEPLRTEDGKYWLDVVGDEGAVVREMEVRGAGDLECLNGCEMKNGLVIGVSQRIQ